VVNNIAKLLERKLILQTSPHKSKKLILTWQLTKAEKGLITLQSIPLLGPSTRIVVQ